MDKLTTYFPRMPPNANPEFYLQPLVWLAFSSGLLLIRASSWKRLVGDISVALLCIALHFLQLSMLFVAIAIGYAICYGTPGCFARSDLPSRAAFMRGLTVTANQEHCNICHDDVERLASLPCDDFCCAGCFLATKVCTVCPYMYCKNPLYDQDHDRRHATLIKGLHACLALAHGFGSYVAGHYAKQGSFVPAGLLLGAAGSSLCVYLALLTYQVCSASR